MHCTWRHDRIPVNAYAQAPKELAAGEKAPRETRYDTADCTIRGSYAFDAPDERGLTLPMIHDALGREGDGIFARKQR